MSWTDVAEGARLADSVKHLILYLLAANHVTTVSRSNLERFLGGVGAHLAEPNTVKVPKPLVCRHLTFTASVATGGELQINCERTGGQSLVVQHPKPYPNVSGITVSDKEWQFTVT